MRRFALLLPSLAALLFCEPGTLSLTYPVRAVHRAPSVKAGATASWKAEVGARIRDASHQFFQEPGQLRAEVPEQGLTARFDDGGARIARHDSSHPITVRAARLGRARSGAEIARTVPGLGDCQEGKADPEGRCIARLQYTGGGLTEWWEAGRGGFEQGWVLTERPEGHGPVQIDVEVRGADAVVGGASVELRGDDGSLLAVRGLRAWDARGDDVPAWFERGDDGFRVGVDDVGAVYPVEVDPVYTSADWTVEGSAGADGFADEVAGVGDTNGDGYDDALVMATGGETFLFLGSATGLGSVAATMVDGASPLGAAGDVNGDGYDDVVIGASLYFGGAAGLSDTLASQASHSGVAVGDVNGDGYGDLAHAYISYNECSADIYVGSPTGLGATSSTTLNIGSCYTALEAPVAAAGDVNGDGYGDLILGCACLASHVDWEAGERVADWSGTAAVYLGSASGPSTSSMSSEAEQDYGAAVSGAGDVDGDGYDDVMVYAGAHDDVTGFTGRVYVLLGSSGGTLTSPSATLEGEEGTHLSSTLSALGDVDGDGYADIGVGADVFMGSSAGVATVPVLTLGWDVHAAGDTNGDGYADVILGDSSYDHGFGTDRTGAAWLYPGSGTAPLDTPTLLTQPGDGLGGSVATADVNDDGFDDLVIGVYRYDEFRGEALVYHGSATGLATSAASSLTGDARGDCFGYSVATAGDTDGDGYDDVIVGAFGAGDYGAAYTYAGSSTGVVRSASATISGDAEALYLGYRVAGVGDVNGDGYDDVVASPYPGTNHVRVYAGSPSGTESSPAASVDLSCSPSAVSGAGDVNGDGYDDLAIGCEDADSNIGAAYLYEGAASGIAELASTTLRGEDVNDRFGHSLSLVGDIDGDGYDDVVVGAYGHSGGAGRVYAYHGSATGLSPTARAILTGSSSSDAFGGWVGIAGDTDGDGFDDVAVAAPGAGFVYIQPGSEAGLDVSPTVVSTGYASLGDILTAGDFNGDGLLDMARGDPGNDPGGGEVSAWYGCIDADLDGFCERSDCDDSDPTINVLFYVDDDRDGFGDPALPTTVCAPEAGYAEDNTDCDDASAAVNPDEAEVCDGADIDEDCDGVASPVLYYTDADGDGYGDPAAASDLCDQAAGYVPDRTDCDDTSAGTNPGMTEVCDDADIDEDCDHRADDDDLSATGQSTFYADEDGDGYGGSVEVLRCDGLASTDCDDGAAAVHPDATESCDGVDNDCDGTVDVDAADAVTWYADADADGFTDGDVGQESCSTPAGFAEGTEDDCDDTDPEVYPGAGDPPGDGIDQNCNGRDTLSNDGACGCTTGAPTASTMLVLLAAALLRRRSR